MTRFRLGLCPVLLLASCVALPPQHPPRLAAEGGDATRERHTVHAMAGLTAGRKDDGPTFATAWEYRALDKIGLGAFGDVVFGSPTTALLGGAGYFHPTPALTVLAGPGIEIHDGDARLFARVGGFYDFPMGDWSLGPALFFDFGLGDIAASAAIAFRFDF